MFVQRELLKTVSREVMTENVITHQNDVRSTSGLHPLNRRMAHVERKSAPHSNVWNQPSETKHAQKTQTPFQTTMLIFSVRSFFLTSLLEIIGAKYGLVFVAVKWTYKTGRPKGNGVFKHAVKVSVILNDQPEIRETQKESLHSLIRMPFGDPTPLPSDYFMPRFHFCLKNLNPKKNIVISKKK